MRVELPTSGTYVVAVSGGVDSAALLDMLSKQPGIKVVVAHFDHGIREDSEADRVFVQELAHKYRLPFVYDAGRLGTGASEAKAREARYKFLNSVLVSSGADAIITAHHQDDLLETAIINMLRGSGRKGLTALANRPGLLRPLLSVRKSELEDYAEKNGLEWREDSTNDDTAYLRNYVRHKILPRFGEADRQDLLNTLAHLEENNNELDRALAEQLAGHSKKNKIDRQWFSTLPHEVAREVLADWLRANGLRSFDSGTLERLAVAAKVSGHKRKYPVVSGWHMLVSKKDLALEHAER
jgi:tRNA(Ile)-lysidine synthase